MMPQKNNIQVDWPFSDEVHSDSPLVQNRSTVQGREAGAELVRFYHQSLGGAKDLRCLDCAARPGTLPNGSESTIMDLLKCIAEGVPFMCHVDPHDVCAGYAILRSSWIRR